MARRSRPALSTRLAAALLASVFLLPFGSPKAGAADGPIVVARDMDINSLDPARA